MNDSKGENGTWKNAALHVLWAIIVAIMGWFMTEGRTDREHIRSDAQRVEQKVADDNAEIAVLKAEMGYIREAIQRVESGVDRLQRDRDRPTR